MRVLKAHFSERYYENYESHSHPATPQTKSSCIIRLHAFPTSVKIVYKTSCEHSIVITLVVFIAVAIGIPQILVAMQQKEVRTQSEQIEALQQEMETYR